MGPVTKLAMKPAMKAAREEAWWLRSLSGTVLGATLALGLAGLWAWWGPGGITAPEKVQFTMWLIAPLWMLALSAVYFTRSGLRALLTLLALNGCVHGALWWTRQVAGA